MNDICTSCCHYLCGLPRPMLGIDWGWRRACLTGSSLFCSMEKMNEPVHMFFVNFVATVISSGLVRLVRSLPASPTPGLRTSLSVPNQCPWQRLQAILWAWATWFKTLFYRHLYLWTTLNRARLPRWFPSLGESQLGSSVVSRTQKVHTYTTSKLCPSHHDNFVVFSNPAEDRLFQGWARHVS